jgi:intein/homing endonuclease
MKIKKISYLQERSDVYDITTQTHHNFFANNILVHNCGE